MSVLVAIWTLFVFILKLMFWIIMIPIILVWMILALILF